MTVKVKMVWAVIALVAVAAGSCVAQDRWVEVQGPYGTMRVLERDVPVTWREAPVTVDGSYASEHPEQRGLQAVAADTRESISDHEVRIGGIERRVGALESDPPQTATPLPPVGGTGSSAPAQSSGRDTTPATEPTEEVTEMYEIVREGGVTASQLVGIFGGLGLLGILIWIAVSIGRRGQIVPLAGLANAAALNANGQIRVSGTDGAGGAYALRIDPTGQPASIPQAGNGQATGGAQNTPVVVLPTPPPGTPAQRLLVASLLGNIGAQQTDNNINIVVLAAANQVPPTNLADTQAINGLIATLRGQNLLP